MSTFTGFLYSLGVCALLAISLIGFVLILNLLKAPNSDKKGSPLLLITARIVGILIFVFCTALIFEIGKSIEWNSKFFRNLIILIPFIILTSGYARENTNLSRQVLQGNYEQEMGAILMNGSGSIIWAIPIFYFWQDLNNIIFFNLPFEIINSLL